ncbi:RidA family protein [Caldisericum exile]|uniref:Endoribonuclease L-PSP/chorismate mutase-like domain-containing protein n=1 Tax=Caldisericum exile (strain DSM 21853 / NBRC 104410 / AZM16c01) TaxID=511051 RepID=A0A7U6GES1_CALEA|nr:RidA family protein [Caldisericum exile]BAL80997.1 hypothetical protein CSE_08710 [Caldisericum exile AZM16c01]
MGIEDNLKSLGLELPKPLKTLGSYVPVITTDSKLLFFSGVIPVENGIVIKGKFGKDLKLEDAKKPAQLIVLSILANIKEITQNFSRIKQIVKIEGYVNSTEDFEEQPKVMNEVSNLLVSIFGEKGKHTRIAISVNSLPMGACLEVAGIIELN